MDTTLEEADRMFNEHGLVDLEILREKTGVSPDEMKKTLEENGYYQRGVFGYYVKDQTPPPATDN